MCRLIYFLLAGLALFALPVASPAAPMPKHSLLKKTGASEKFTFVVYGDTRSDPVAHARVIEEILRLHPEFVLQSGDLVSDGGNPRQWAEFERITQPLRDAHIPYYPARGNHDRGPYYPRYVTQPFDSGDKAGHLYYAFTRHQNRFIIVDSIGEDNFQPGSKQYVWLKKELEQAQKTAVNTFVMFHEGPYSVGPHGPTLEAQRYLHPLLVKYRPRAVFCGHDHLYYRTTRDGVTYIVTGGGGAPPYAPQNRQTAIPGDVFVPDVDSLGRQINADSSEYKALIYHAVRCEVDGSRVTITAIRPDGGIIDKFSLGPK